MSKTIDPENMSKFDREYLISRNIDPDEYAERYRLTEDDEIEDAEVEEGQEPGRTGQAGGAEADDEEGEDVPYSEWSMDELRIELRNRELDDSGRKKAELIARLEADDAAEEPTGTTEDDDEETDDSDAQPANPGDPERGTLNRD